MMVLEFCVKTSRMTQAENVVLVVTPVNRVVFLVLFQIPVPYRHPRLVSYWGGFTLQARTALMQVVLFLLLVTHFIGVVVDQAAVGLEL